MLSQTEQTTESEEKPHRSHTVNEKARRQAFSRDQQAGAETTWGVLWIQRTEHRRPRKIRRTGRHTAPSQVEKVAEKAGKAAPAMAIAGVLVAAAPQAHAAEKTPAKATAVTEQQARTDALVRRAQPATRTYTVRSGDTLSSIAESYYHNPGDWQWIYEANRSKISNPNIIYVGESLTIPYSAPSGTTSYTPRHAKATAQAAVLTTTASSLSGTLGCSGLEALWEAAAARTPRPSWPPRSPWRNPAASRTP